MESDPHSREEFEDALGELESAYDLAVQTELEYRRYATHPAQGEAGRKGEDLHAAWEGVVGARRRLLELYKAGHNEAIALNDELSTLIERFGPESPDVADFRSRVLGEKRGEPSPG